MTDSSREAQAEIRNAIAKSETAYDAKRGIIGTNLTSNTFDASRCIRYAYIGSYAWFRSSHVERRDRDGRDYVIFPQQPALYYLYRPLTYFDARVTGMRFHIGPHRS